ncbi:MAG: hypothetical protein IPL52_10860 [Flavobacteriales bacterium]|nr:hypothetical protein [Flavobacteriales bacterium]
MPTATTPKRSWTKWGASTYINVLKGAALVGRNAYQLNSEEVGNLMELVDEGHYDRPSGWASNLLCAVYKVCRPPATGAVELPKANRSRERERPVNTTAEASFGAYPNPARTWVAFAYNRKGWRRARQHCHP